MAGPYCHACVRMVPGNTSNWTQIQTKTAELCSKVTFIYFLDATDIKGRRRSKPEAVQTCKQNRQGAVKTKRFK